MEEFTGNVARTHRSRLGIEEPRHWTECIPWRKVGLFALAFGLLVWPFRVTSNGFIVRWAPPIVDPRPGCFQEREKQLVGLWKSNRTAGFSRILLTESGTFHQRKGSSLWRGESAGTWRVEGDQIVLRRQEAYSLNRSLPTFWCMALSEDRIWIVPWGERMVLVEDRHDFEFDLIVADHNAHVSAETSRTRGLQRDGEPALKGRPQLPSPWREKLLPGELRGAVLEVQPNGRLRVSLGSRDGVTPGLRLFHQVPGARRSSYLEVAEVREADCDVSVSEAKDAHPIQVDDKLSTWYPVEIQDATPR